MFGVDITLLLLSNHIISILPYSVEKVTSVALSGSTGAIPASTVIVQVADLPPVELFTVIVAVPEPLAITNPF